jgi:hypothetical protein
MAVQPLLDQGSFNSGELRLFFISLLDNGETIWDRKQPMVTNAPLELTVTFHDSTLAANLACTVTTIDTGVVELQPATGRVKPSW